MFVFFYTLTFFPRKQRIEHTGITERADKKKSGSGDTPPSTVLYDRQKRGFGETTERLQGQNRRDASHQQQEGHALSTGSTEERE